MLKIRFWNGGCWDAGCWDAGCWMESKKGTEKGEKEGNGKAVLECWGAGVLGAWAWVLDGKQKGN